MSVVKRERYEKARKYLTPYPKEEAAMRVVERGAIEYGRAAMRRWFVAELKSRGFKELASYLGKLAPR